MNIDPHFEAEYLNSKILRKKAIFSVWIQNGDMIPFKKIIQTKSCIHRNIYALWHESRECGQYKFAR